MRRIICSLCLLVIQFPLTVTLCSAGDFQELMQALPAGNLRASASSLEEYVKQHPKHAESRFQLAKTYLGLNQNPLAEDQLRSCMELATPGSDMHNNCILLLKQMSQSKFGAQGSPPSDQQINTSTSTKSSNVSAPGTASRSGAGFVQQFGTLQHTTISGNASNRGSKAPAPPSAPAPSQKTDTKLQKIQQ